MRALIVDDSKTMRLIIGRALRELGLSVCEAAHGQEALALLSRGEPVELILADWNMPVCDGYDFVCAVRANPLLSGIFIIMVTTETSFQQIQKALDAGANEYLMKPFTKEALHEKLVLLGIA